MDLDATQEMDSNAVLGKRKRIPEALGASIAQEYTHDSRTTTSLDPRPTQDETDSDAKRPRIPSITMIGTNDLTQTQLMSSKYGPLPPEILQRVFSFTDPYTLGRLLYTCQGFYELLKPGKPLPPNTSRTRYNVVPQDSIWSCLRQALTPEVPGPVKPMTEYDMCKLIYGRRCQFCRYMPSNRSLTTSVTVWNAGPGPKGVRAIWPFMVRSCADCLRGLLVKESELMQSPSSILQHGLSSALFTPSLNYVTSITLRRLPIPHGLQLTKYYFRPQSEELEKQQREARQQGPESYSKWYQSLETYGQTSATHSAQLEQWEESLRPIQASEIVPLDSASASSVSVPSGYGASSATPSVVTATSHSTWRYPQVRSHQPQSHVTGSWGTQTLNMPLNCPPPAPGQESFPSAPGSIANSYRSSTISVQYKPRTERTSQDVTRLKAERRTAIERRCRDLTPAILPQELEGMKAFHAALQITTPLNERAWELLKGHLLTEQRESAIKALADQGDDLSWVSRQTDIPEPQSEPRDIATLISQTQRPTRDKLFEIAQEYTRRRYMGGTGLTEETAPSFAADVLQHVRQQFYANQLQDDIDLSLHGHPPVQENASGTRSRKLKLDDMKYVFEKCVKQYTELVTPNLFLCSECDTQGKHFVFDAVIQHYAAKHTSAFSRGNQVVYWKAEWPENPPFRLNPSENIGISTLVPRALTPTMSLESAPFQTVTTVTPVVTATSDVQPEFSAPPPQSLTPQGNIALASEPNDYAAPYIPQARYVQDPRQDVYRVQPTPYSLQSRAETLPANATQLQYDLLYQAPIQVYRATQPSDQPHDLYHTQWRQEVEEPIHYEQGSIQRSTDPHQRYRYHLPPTDTQRYRSVSNVVQPGMRDRVRDGDTAAGDFLSKIEMPIVESDASHAFNATLAVDGMRPRSSNSRTVAGVAMDRGSNTSQRHISSRDSSIGDRTVRTMGNRSDPSDPYSEHITRSSHGNVFERSARDDPQEDARYYSQPTVRREITGNSRSTTEWVQPPAPRILAVHPESPDYDRPAQRQMPNRVVYVDQYGAPIEQAVPELTRRRVAYTSEPIYQQYHPADEPYDTIYTGRDRSPRQGQYYQDPRNGKVYEIIERPPRDYVIAPGQRVYRDQHSGELLYESDRHPYR